MYVTIPLMFSAWLLRFTFKLSGDHMHEFIKFASDCLLNQRKFIS